MIEWFEKNYPDDKDIVAWAKHMTCVYGMEGIEMFYRAGMSNKDVERIFSEYPCRELLEDYKNIMLSKNRIIQISEFFNDRKSFIRKNRMKGIKENCGKRLKKIPTIKKMYYKKKYPIVLDKNLYLA